MLAYIFMLMIVNAASLYFKFYFKLANSLS